MQLGANFANIKATESKGFKSVNRSGQKLTIVGVEDGISKTSGNPMLTISHDIAEGEFAGQFSKFPLKKYLVYGNEKQLGGLKANFLKIIAENKGMFPEEDVFAGGGFDEQRLVNCVVGADLDYNDNGYAEIRWYTSIEDAAKNDRVITKPEKKTAAPAVDAKAAWGFDS